GCGIEWIADLDRRRELQESVEEMARDFFLQQQARARDAGLALVMKDGERAAADRGGDVWVIEYDVGTLPSPLELHALQVTRRCSRDFTPSRGRAGERDLRDLWMLGKILSGDCAVAGDNINDAGWELHIADEFCDLQRTQRRQLGRLQNH